MLCLYGVLNRLLIHILERHWSCGIMERLGHRSDPSHPASPNSGLTRTALEVMKRLYLFRRLGISCQADYKTYVAKVRVSEHKLIPSNAIS